MMDKDQDGILGKEDLRATWDQVGKLISDKELDDQLAEAPGPVNFTQLLSLFAARMSGGENMFYSYYNDTYCDVGFPTMQNSTHLILVCFSCYIDYYFSSFMHKVKYGISLDQAPINENEQNFHFYALSHSLSFFDNMIID